MDNYVYIISSLPAIGPEGNGFSNELVQKVLSEIREQLSPRDNACLDFLEKGFEPESLDREFYIEAAKSPNAFIREYFDFDRKLRNLKARWLNRAFDRPLEENTIVLDEESDDDFEEAQAAEAILDGKDLLKRERSLDELVWDGIESRTVFEYFSFDVILAFAAKLNIVRRWLKLDEQTGRELFRRLVSEIQSTFKGVEFENKL